MKIGIDGREFKYGTMTGIARYLDNFIRYAVEARPEYKFFLYGNQDTYAHYDFPNLYIRIVPERKTIYWDQFVLPRLIAEDKVDLFFSPYIKGPYFARCPYICTVHDVLFLMLPEYWTLGRLFYNFAFILFGMIVLSRAKIVLTDSESSKRDAIRLFRVKRQKIRVIPLGISARFHSISNMERIESVKRKYGIGEKYILYVGNFLPHKNIKRLICAYDLLPEKTRHTYQLVLAGRKDKYARRLERFAKRLKPPGEVMFTDMVSDEDLISLYAGADLFVLPSLYEGFGLPALEAMACGVPVITSRCASLPEVVGDAAVLVNPRKTQELKEAMERVLKDKAERERLVQLGIDRVKQFTVEKSIRSLMEVLEEPKG